MKKRIPLFLALLLMLAVTLSACGSAATATPVPPTKAAAAATTAPAAKPTGGTAAKPPKVAPKADYKSIPQTPEFDKFVADAAKQIGFSNYVYEAWEMPPNASWDDTFKYYSDQLAQAGWGGQGVTQEFEGGKLGAFVDKTTQTGVVVFYIASPDGKKPAYDLAIFGE